MHALNHQLANGSVRLAPAVLVADDDADSRDTLSHILAQQGYQPWEAANGREALELIMNHACIPQLILLDRDMPIRNGEQFIGALRRPPNLFWPKIIVLSGHAAKPIAGTSAVLQKPLEVVQLLA